MHLLKASVVLLSGTLMLAAASPAAAIELPDIHLLSGERYSMAAEGSVTGVVEGGVIGKFETVLGEKITFTGVKISLELLELSSLGPDVGIYTGLFEPRSKTKCHTLGAAEGTGEIPGEYHMVVVSTEPLTPTFLMLFKEVLFECNGGKLKVKLRSPVIFHLNKVTSGTDVGEFGLAAKCSGKGVQDLREYLNGEGIFVKAQLMMNFGLGFEPACEEFNEELLMTATKMVDFLF